MKSIIVLAVVFLATSTPLYAEAVTKKDYRTIDITKLKKDEQCIRLSQNKKVGAVYKTFLNCKESGNVYVMTPDLLPRYFNSNGAGGILKTGSKILVD
jgi:ABC-type Fe2+-enterobactin transport system substrate-binding protein